MLISIPYPENSADVFARIADLPWAAFLDSCKPMSQQGRYDILTALPYKTLYISAETPNSFQLLHEHFAKDLGDTYETPTNPVPFTGGALGYFSYDGEIKVGIYDWAIIIDHQSHTAYLTSDHRDPMTQSILPDILARLETPAQNATPFRLRSPFISSLTQSDYKKAFERIQEYIRAGDCYQTNLSQQFTASFEGSPWEAYRRLRQVSPVP
ncbi:MAG: chorismate-binding protein, partial [Gammaproteobacteria bacterium]